MLGKVIKCTCFLVFTGIGVAAQQGGDSTHISVVHQSMGTIVTLKAFPQQLVDVQQLRNQFLSMLDSLAYMLSDYEDQNPVAQLSAMSGKARPLCVPQPLFEVTSFSKNLWKLTDGYFDVTIGKVTHFWRDQFKKEKIPKPGKMKKKLKHVGMDKVILDSTKNSIYLTRKKMQLDFGAVGKGYIGDQLGLFLRSKGVKSFLIDLGGDLVAGDAPPGKEGWSILCNWLEGNVLIANEALATSGPDYQFFHYRGRVYSHVINPKTGWGVEAPSTCTVIAKTGALADAMASVLPLLDRDKIESIQKDLILSFVLINEDGFLITPDFNHRLRKF